MCIFILWHIQCHGTQCLKLLNNSDMAFYIKLPSRLTYSLHTYMSTYSKYSDTGIISIYFSSSPVNKQSNLKYLAKTVLTVCSELSKPLTAVSFSLASLKMQSFLSLVSYRTGIFNGAVIISMQLAETLTEGETDLLITDTDNE